MRNVPDAAFTVVVTLQRHDRDHSTHGLHCLVPRSNPSVSADVTVLIPVVPRPTTYGGRISRSCAGMLRLLPAGIPADSTHWYVRQWSISSPVSLPRVPVARCAAFQCGDVGLPPGAFQPPTF
jgi:hypothetical protein